MELKKLHNTPNELVDKNNRELHQKDFGFDVPNGFFENNKQAILKETVYKTNKKQRTIQLITSITAVAAALLLFFSLYTANQTSVQFSMNDAESELLIDALFENESTINELADAYMLEGLDIDENILN